MRQGVLYRIYVLQLHMHIISYHIIHHRGEPRVWLFGCLVVRLLGMNAIDINHARTVITGPYILTVIALEVSIGSGCNKALRESKHDDGDDGDDDCNHDA